MLSVALLSILLPVATATSGLAAPSRALAADPSVRISLDHRDYEPGERARVTVQVRDDGYLLVLRLSTDGYARVLFPLDPRNDNFVRGNGTYEIRGRGDRDAFTVDDRSGTGTVYAAWSTEPFRFDDFVLGDHWDYRVIDGALLQGDPEAGLTELAQRMSTGHFDYDLVSYSVERQVAYSGTTHYVTAYPAPLGCYGICDPWCPGYYPYRYSSGFRLSIGFGRPWGWHRAGWYNPFYYDPFYYDPFYYGRRHRGCYYCGYGYPRVVVINRPGHRGSRGYQWKPGSFGGGGNPGVHYRPRTVLASTNARVSSPLFVASKYRRVVDDSRPDGGRRLGSGAIGTPRISTGGAALGVSHRERAGRGRGRASDDGSAASSGLATPRRARPAEASGRRSSAQPRSMPRRSEPPPPTRVARPSRSEPRVIAPRSVEPRQRPERAEPRPQPQRAQPRPQAQRVQPRPQPQRVQTHPQPQRAQPRPQPQRAQPRAQPHRTQARSAPAPRAQRSQPRAAPSRSQPRSSPAARSTSSRRRP